MEQIARDKEAIQSLALSDLLTRLDLSKDAQVPTYRVLYLENLPNEKETKEKHQEIVRKIVNWPRDDNNRVRFDVFFANLITQINFFQFDCCMNVLMTLILAFHPDFYFLINKDKVEKIQLKYIMMLQRYLR